MNARQPANSLVSAIYDFGKEGKKGIHKARMTFQN